MAGANNNAPLKGMSQEEMILKAAFDAGFNDCKERVEAILCRAAAWPIPKKLTNPAARRRYIVSEIHRELERLKP